MTDTVTGKLFLDTGCPACVQKKNKGSVSMYKGHPDQIYGCNTYSQHGEDLLIVSLFDQLGIVNPSYLDLGAHHPVNISNTHLLYTRGSRGVNVEANEKLIPEFKKYRTEDITVCCAVGLRDNGNVQLIKFDDWSGRNTTSEIEAAAYGRPVKERVFVKAHTPNYIVNMFCKGVWPDFLSVDLEGIDYEVIQHSIELVPNRPKIICVETRRAQSVQMKELMLTKGYQFFVRMGENLIFVRDDLMEVLL